MEQEKISTATWRAAKYERISRKDEREKAKSNSIESQEKLINYFLKKNLDIEAVDDYIDDDYSGFNFDRPSFQRMVFDIESGKINCIIVKDLSRFGRDQTEMLNYILIKIPQWKIRFIAINDDVDNIKNPDSMKNAEMRINLFFNDEYGWDTSEKVRNALTSRRKRGMFIGSFAPYGYQKDPNNKHKLIIDNYAASIVRYIFKSFIDGKSILEITRMLNGKGILNPTQYKKNEGLNATVHAIKKTEGLWIDRTVRRMLANKLYLGHMIQGKMEVPNFKFKKCLPVPTDRQIIVKNTHEPIIDKYTFDTAQELLSRNIRTSPKSNQIGIFAGYIKCADCGRAMAKRTVTQPYKVYHYYNCTTYRRLHECTKHAIQIDGVEKAVLYVLQKYIDLAVHLDDILKNKKNMPSHDIIGNRLTLALKNFEKEKEKKLAYLRDLYPDYKNNLLTLELYFSYKTTTEKELQVIEDKIAATKRELDECTNEHSQVEDFISKLKAYGNIEFLTRELVVELIDMIWVHEGGEVTIDFKFADIFKNMEYFNNSLEKQAI